MLFKPHTDLQFTDLPLNKGELVHRACKNGHFHLLKTQNFDFTNYKLDRQGKSCLQIAVEHSQFDTVSYLIEKGSRDERPLSSDHPLIRCMIVHKFKLVLKMV
jgi:ankyrin repeat protein